MSSHTDKGFKKKLKAQSQTKTLQLSASGSFHYLTRSAPDTKMREITS
jgi:hypothetical protein